MYKLSVLGKNGLYPTKNSPTSGYLLEVGTLKLCIDFGAGVFLNLKEYIDPEKLDFIILTHTHYDHISDIGVLSYYLQTKQAKLKIYLPTDGSEISNSIIKNTNFECFDIKRLNGIVLENVLFEIFRMNHPIPTFSIKTTYENRVFAYTSDTNICDNIEKLYANANLVVADSAFSNENWAKDKPHMSAKICAEYAKSSNTNCKLILSHLNPNANTETLLLEAKKIYTNAEIACIKSYDI